MYGGGCLFIRQGDIDGGTVHAYAPALFLLEVSACMALTSTGPILSIPLAYLIKGSYSLTLSLSI